MSKTLGNLALICQKWSLKLLLLKSGGTRAVQKGAKKALPLIITNSKAKKKGAHFEHLNYHLLSILIVVYHDLFPDAEVLEDIAEYFVGSDLALSGDFCQVGKNEAEVFSYEVTRQLVVKSCDDTAQIVLGME